MALMHDCIRRTNFITKPRLWVIFFAFAFFVCGCCKIPKISPSKYKPPKPLTQKTLREIAPPNISPPGACTWKIALKYKLKQRENSKFTSNYKASPIDCETQISLHRYAPTNISPSKNKPLKRAFEKYKPQGLFSEFYGIPFNSTALGFHLCKT